ncbi:MAG: hypothetical protein ACI9VM_000357 [Candidatus Azotimanducaceae bacterium]|jgi:hypothetical protein
MNRRQLMGVTGGFGLLLKFPGLVSAASSIEMLHQVNKPGTTVDWTGAGLDPFDPTHTKTVHAKLQGLSELVHASQLLRVEDRPTPEGVAAVTRGITRFYLRSISAKDGSLVRGYPLVGKVNEKEQFLIMLGGKEGDRKVFFNVIARPAEWGKRSKYYFRVIWNRPGTDWYEEYYFFEVCENPLYRLVQLGQPDCIPPSFKSAGKVNS